MSSNQSVLDFEKDLMVVGYYPVRYQWQCPACKKAESSPNIGYLLQFKDTHEKECLHKEEA